MKPLTNESGGLRDGSSDCLNRLDRGLIAVLVVCTLALYMQVRGFAFQSLDDHLYVSSNAMISQGLSPHTLRWALTATPNGNWHPLTTIIQLIISRLFGVNPGPFHVANALLHTLNVALLYLVFRRSTGRLWPAFFTALLWGVHPLRIESVAWISELKDVVYGVFWLACMLAYIRFARHRTKTGYALVFLWFVLSLLGKPMSVTLPLVLLLMDCWPLSRSAVGNQRVAAGRWWTARTLEKLPMLLVSAADILAQKNLFTFMTNGVPLRLRIENALVSYVWYLRDVFFPRHLHLLYLHPAVLGKGIPIGEPIAALALLAVISIAVTLAIRTRPYLFVGWFWFLGTLVPVIGLVQVGEQSRADRFTYMPAVGITMAVVWLVSDAVARRPARRFFAVTAGGLAAGALVWISCLYLPAWKDDNAMASYLCQVDPRNYYGLSELGYGEFLAGHDKKAIEMEKRAVALAPRSGRAVGVYALVLGLTDHLAQAQDEFVKAIKLSASEENWDGLGMVYDKEAGKCDDHHNPEAGKFRHLAIEEFQHAIDQNPQDAGPRDYMARQLAALPGRLDEAIGVLGQLVNDMPSYAQAQGDLASALLLKGDVPHAIDHFQAAIADGSKDPDLETNLAWLVATSPQASFSDVLPLVSIAKDACDQTKDQQAAALDAYADCLARVTRFDDAVKAAGQAITAAEAAHEPAVAAGIRKRLELYEKGRAYVATDEEDRHAGKLATTQATTEK